MSDHLMNVAVSAYQLLTKGQRLEFAARVVEEAKKGSELREITRREHSCCLPCCECPGKARCDKVDNEIIDIEKKKVSECNTKIEMASGYLSIKLFEAKRELEKM